MGKPKYSFLLSAPLGYSEPIGGAYPGAPAKQLEDAFRADFKWVQFKVDHLGKDTFRIKVKFSGILTAEGGRRVDRVELVTGMVGDSLRLKNGQFLKIEGLDDHSTLLIRIGAGRAVEGEKDK